MKQIYLLISVFLLLSCTDNEPHVIQRGLITQKAMVVSARAEASKIGKDIMEQGGNAFDAMVATEMALAVTYPYAGNLGGGGFMVYRLANGQIGALDYREKAPQQAYKDMFLDSLGEVIPELSTQGAMAVGVPGTISGIFAAHEKFGSMPIETLLQPVVNLAREGYEVTEDQAGRFEEYSKVFTEVNEDSTMLYSTAFAKADTVKNNALAETLSRIIANGNSEFYGGETGQKMVDYIQSRGGIMTIEDLKAYEAQWREPIVFNYDNLRIVSMSPPSSGGVCMAQIFESIESYDVSQYGHNSEKTIQLITEAERRAYADRSFYLGDPDFVDIPVETLISETYNKNRMNTFSWEEATSSQNLDHGEIPKYESMETTHYSIVDPFGNAIAVTTTLNGAYGSKLYIEELGFFLNNEMDDFSSKPGVPNMFGLLGAEANAISPGKRMLSSMTPTLVEKDGEFWMSVGTPGGSTIITSVMQTILNVHEFGMGMQEAVNAPRFHHQWLPDEILFEPNSFDETILSNLVNKGYTINQKDAPVIGKVDGILKLEDGTLEGGADRRGDDTANGF